jgi:Spy/CpxP family protein refolding chaperone
MSGLDRWKIVLTLIAIFVAGAVTGGFFAIRAMKYETPGWSEAPIATPFAVGRWLGRLHLTPDQDQKLRPIIEQADNELRNLRALDLREIEGIFDRAQDRMNPVLTPDQRERLRKMLEERKQRLGQWINVPEP